MNSLMITVISVVLIVLISSLAAFAFAVMDFKGKNGEPLVSTSYDPEKWQLAAEAADKAVEVVNKEGLSCVKGQPEKQQRY